MKKSCFFLVFAMFLMFVLVVQAKPRKSKFIVKDGEPQGHLFTPSKSGRPLQLAVKELREYLKKITGAEFPLSWRNPQRSDIGITLAVCDESKWKGKESGQAFTIEQRLKPRQMVIITGNTEMAVLYGVHQYLRELGVNWFTPGEIGENVPKLKDIEVKKSKKNYSPSFLKRGLNLSGVNKSHFDCSDLERYRDVIHHEYDLWLLRNRIGFQRSIHRRHWFDFNATPTSGSHAIKRVVLKGVDIKKEPERFPLVTRDGKKKRRAKRAQICFTNEKNIQQAIKSAVEFFKNVEATKGERNTDFDELEDTFAMGLADCSGICECEACSKIAGNPPYSQDRLVWSFYNRVAQGLNKQMPGKKIGLFTPYNELHRPPADVKIEANIVAVSARCFNWSNASEDKPYYPMTKDYIEDIKATRKAGAEMRNYDYTMWLGTPQPLNILDAVEAYKKLGYKYYHAEVMSRNEQLWPILWTLAQYTWDSKQTTRELLKQYCDEYYGTEGSMVFDLLQKIDANSRKIPKIIYGGIADTQMTMTDNLIREGMGSLKKAIKNSKGKEKTRLERFRDSFEMQSRVAQCYRAYSDALNRRTLEAVKRSEQNFTDFEKFWKTRNLSEICSPNVLKKIQEIAKIKIPIPIEPKGRKELEDKKVWMRNLFALDTVPDKVPNLFPMPEIWKFRTDHNDKGLQEGWAKVDYDDSKDWQTLSTWDFFESQGYKNIGGRFWYRLKFKAPSFPKGKKIYLRIGSLDDDGDIFLNGKLAYSRKHINPHDWKSSFAVDATKYIKPGEENTIAVRGYDSFGAGGIWRPCALYTD